MKLAYDIEIYPNLFVVCFINVLNPSQRWVFVIYEGRDDTEQLIKFLRSIRNSDLIGYNSLRFDDILLKAILSGRATTVQEIYELADAIIDRNKEVEDFWDIYNYPVEWRSVDTMVLHRLRELGVSLKFVGVILKHPLIQDLPIKPGTLIDPSQYDLIIEYCFNDCEITAKLYLRSADELKVREELGKMFGVDVYTDSRSGAAQKIMLQQYSEETGIPVWKLRKEQTVRHIIPVKDCIGPNLVFETPKMKGLLGVLNTLTLYQNTNERNFAMYYDDEGNVSSKPLEAHRIGQTQSFYKIKIRENFKYATIVELAGKTFKVGIGGLHSQDTPGVYETNDEWVLILADVASYYPSMQVINKITPKHWGDYYIDILNRLMHERLVAKEFSKEDADFILKALALKIVINSIFGRLGDKFSPLLDPLAMTTVTLSGELYLLDLIEKFWLNLEKSRLISANTDGVWYLVHRSELEAFKKVGNDWSERLGLVLEYDEFKGLWQRDVNNYLAIDAHGHVKTKGTFYPGEYVEGTWQNDLKEEGIWERPIDKGYDAPVVAIAIYRYLSEGISPRDTILNHRDVYDFMISKKVGNQFQSVEFSSDGETVMQKTNRFIVVRAGGDSFVKRRLSDGSLENIVAGEYVQIMNRVTDSDAHNYDIKYEYYFDRVDRILETLYPPQQALLEF